MAQMSNPTFDSNPGPFKFNRVLFNDHNAYDPATGAFTAPYSGNKKNIYIWVLSPYLATVAFRD